MAEQTNFYAVQRGVPRSFKPVYGITNLYLYINIHRDTGEGQRQFLDVSYIKLTLAMDSVLLNSMQKFITLKKG